MIRNAEAVANRDTLPVTNQRFLNIAPDSRLYTTVGRLLEKLCLVEIPQFSQVVRGTLALVGSRPLPENVIRSIKEDFPYVEDRFLSRAGLTGPVQLIGRYDLSDGDRLELEITYCKICLESYSVFLDLYLLVSTVLTGMKLRSSLTKDEILRIMHRYRRRASRDRVVPLKVSGERTASLNP